MSYDHYEEHGLHLGGVDGDEKLAAKPDELDELGLGGKVPNFDIGCDIIPEETTSNVNLSYIYKFPKYSGHLAIMDMFGNEY